MKFQATVLVFVISSNIFPAIFLCVWIFINLIQYIAFPSWWILLYRCRHIFIFTGFYSSCTIAYYTGPNSFHFQYYLFQLYILPIQLGILYLRKKCFCHLLRFRINCMSFSRRCPFIVVRELVSTENFYGYPSDRVASTLPDWRRFHTKINTQILHFGGCAGGLVTSPLKLRNIHSVRERRRAKIFKPQS
jgi:hypothetical protein